jgi:hypothetical protein
MVDELILETHFIGKHVRPAVILGNESFFMARPHLKKLGYDGVSMYCVSISEKSCFTGLIAAMSSGINIYIQAIPSRMEDTEEIIKDSFQTFSDYDFYKI